MSYVSTFGPESSRVVKWRAVDGIMKSSRSVRRDGDGRTSRIVFEFINSVADDVGQEKHIGSILISGFFWRIPRPGSGQIFRVVRIPIATINFGVDAPEAKV